MGTKKTCLAHFKDPESRSRDDKAALVERYHEMYDKYQKMLAEAQMLDSKSGPLIASIMSHWWRYASELKRAPQTENLNQLTDEQVQSLNQALKHDQSAGREMWELYETQKKMHAYYDFVEELMAFREEHFVMQKEDEQKRERVKISIATGRSCIRDLGWEMVRRRQAMLDLVQVTR